MATKSATKTRVTKKQVTAHRTRAIKDHSPVWDGCETWDDDTFHRHFKSEFTMSLFLRAIPVDSSRISLLLRMKPPLLFCRQSGYRPALWTKATAVLSRTLKILEARGILLSQSLRFVSWVLQD